VHRMRAALAVIAIGLIAAPFAFRMFDRAPHGAQMIDDFKPYMTTQRLDGYAQHIADIDAGVREGRPFTEGHPTFAQFARDWSPIDRDMSDLITRIRANVGNYEAVAALPRFTLFPWFFVIPGLLILGLLALPRRGARIALVALGIGLVLAPAVFQMFTRAPKGGHMMRAFETIETRAKVEQIQGYFGTIATGQGAVRLEILPELRRRGIADRYPALTRLDERWVPILNDLTPMIGAMSDNVDNYAAVRALPPFPLFPWFFVLPGLLVAGLALRIPERRQRTMIRRTVTVAVLMAAALPATAVAQPLRGTFRIGSGSYFRMAFPGGKKYFTNPDSSARNKTITPLRAGRQGGLRTGGFQEHPRPAFDRRGNSLADAIIRPVAFAGIRFGLATLPRDPQSKHGTGRPAISRRGRTLSGRLAAITAEWNNQYFNQGSPKPGGAGAQVHGRYDPRTHRYVLEWRSPIKGGPFDGFTGLWHLQGVFR
jgi:hypothetical protein